MAAVGGRDTAPELRVRRIVHGLGYRYALNKKSLPGSPDLVLTARRKIIFVHGCFWHMHHCKAGRKKPSSNPAYWSAKRARNVARDIESVKALRALGWTVLVVWECETRDIALADRLAAFLEA
jgi:DNA mismatch endonuclease, patch repair protein